MSAKHRCRYCGHRPGPRTTTPIRKDGNPPRPSKRECGCACHHEQPDDTALDYINTVLGILEPGRPPIVRGDFTRTIPDRCPVCGGADYSDSDGECRACGWVPEVAP